MKNLLTILAIFLATSVFAAKPTHKYVRIKTSQGECVIMLYNATPQHRDNFLKLAKEGFYNGTLFHRVIQNGEAGTGPGRRRPWVHGPCRIPE